MVTVLGEEDRLRALTEATEGIFLEVGYEAASLDTVIARAGGSRRNIYQHYGGKEGLFVAVIGGLTRKYESPFERLDFAEMPAAEAVACFARQLLESVLDPKALKLQRLMIAESVRFPEVSRAIWHSGQVRVEAILTDLLATYQRSGEIGSDWSAEELAGWFVGAVTSGATLRALMQETSSGDTDIDRRQEAERYAKAFLAGVGSRAA